MQTLRKPFESETQNHFVHLLFKIKLLMSKEIKAVEKLFKEFSGKNPDDIIALPLSGSYRQYFRIKSSSGSFIGVYNEDLKENQAFISFTDSFLELGLNVPEFLASNLDENVYLLQDLGDTTLLAYLGIEYNRPINASGIEMYKKTLEQLPLFQVRGGKAVDYKIAYPRHSFDRQSMMWDLNYFKYYFLKLARVPFDEQALEDDFQAFTDFLLKADCNHFLYRDFQSRNVMIFENEPYFIDYQGGRKGALQYDLASILFEAKTSLSAEVRQELMEHYLQALSKQIKFEKSEFTEHFYGYVYIRIMQAMGAYGFRGLYEKKELFLQSIPKALDHLQWLRNNVKLPIAFPHLERVWDLLINSQDIRALADKAIGLTITINSFSYKRGIPADESPNGGGFVFDCRALHNPGRYDEYKDYNGKDDNVIKFLAAETEVTNFHSAVYSLVDNSIEIYISRGFKNLMVSFGCTGGQHRSVYSSEQLSMHIKNKYPKVSVILRHRELEMK